MPKLNEQPESLRPYLFHGVRLSWAEGDKEALGDCPWCGREGKLSINIPTGQWRCFVCNEGQEKEDKSIRGGNHRVFIRMLWERSFDSTKPDDYKALAAERGLLLPSTLVEWQLAKSTLTKNWILPGYNSDGVMTGLYQYVSNGSRRFWLPTPTLGHHLFGRHLFVPEHELIYLCEGLWDSTAWWEVLSMVKPSGDGNGNSYYVPTASREASLLSCENVLGIAGCQTFNEAWIPLFRGKVVCLMCQNDHEKRMCGECRKSYSLHVHQRCPSCGSVSVSETVVAPASYAGMERVSKLIAPVAEAVYYLHWGENGYNPSLPTGYDLRDEIAYARSQ